MLKPGARAPDFQLPDPAGGTFRLSDALRSGPVLLYFYPADATPVCTKEACMYRDHAAELAAAEVRVVGVSPQSAASKAKFTAAHGLTFPLLADEGRAVAKLYGALGLFGLPIPFGVRRVTYLIGPDGIVRDAAAAELTLGAHEALMKRALEQARPPAKA